MDPDTLSKILNKYLHFETSDSILKLQGLGEPLLAKHFTELCKIGKEMGFFVTTTTNGTIYNEEVLQYLDRVIFSIDTLDPIRYRLYRPQAELNIVIENLYKTKEHTHVGINQVLTKYTTKNDVKEIKKFCKIFKLTRSSVSMENWHPSPDSEVEAARKVWGEVEKRITNCNWCNTQFYYDASGNLHPCCIRMNDDYIIGDAESYCRTRHYCGNCPD